MIYGSRKTVTLRLKSLFCCFSAWSLARAHSAPVTTTFFDYQGGRFRELRQNVTNTRSFTADVVYGFFIASPKINSYDSNSTSNLKTHMLYSESKTNTRLSSTS